MVTASAVDGGALEDVTTRRSLLKRPSAPGSRYLRSGALQSHEAHSRQDNPGPFNSGPTDRARIFDGQDVNWRQATLPRAIVKTQKRSSLGKKRVAGQHSVPYRSLVRRPERLVKELAEPRLEHRELAVCDWHVSGPTVPDGPTLDVVPDWLFNPRPWTGHDAEIARQVAAFDEGTA
jgi:hypothetical protein